MPRLFLLFLALLGLTAALYWISKQPNLTAALTPKDQTAMPLANGGTGEDGTQEAGSSEANARLASAQGDTAPIAQSETEVAANQAAEKSKAEPAQDAGAAPAPDTAKPVMPLFEAVTVDAKGAAQVQGRANPGDEVTLLVDDKSAGSAKTADDGKWTMSVQTELKDTEKSLAISARNAKGETLIVPDRVRITPAVKAGDVPVVMLMAQDGTTKTLQGAGAPAASAPSAPPAIAEGGVKTGLVIEKAETEKDGRILIAGRGDAGMIVKAFLGEQALGQATVDALGGWRLEGKPKDAKGNLRLVMQDKGGKDLDVVTLPFTVAADSGAAAPMAAPDKAAADKAAADKAAQEKEAADKAAADKVAKEKETADKATKEKEAADKAAADKAAKEKETADKAAGDKAAADKVAKEKEAADKAAAEKKAADAVAARTAEVKAKPVREAPAKDKSVHEARKPQTAKARRGQERGRALASAPRAKTRYAKVPVVQTVNVRVRRGESLWDLAKRFYGDGDRWTEIERKNDRAIRNPDVIYPGQVLKLRTTTLKTVAIKLAKAKPRAKRKAERTRRGR